MDEQPELTEAERKLAELLTKERLDKRVLIREIEALQQKLIEIGAKAYCRSPHQLMLRARAQQAKKEQS